MKEKILRQVQRLGLFKAGKPDMLLILGFTGIAIFCIIVFYPSLYHVPRADHLFYLADMAGKEDFHSLVIDSSNWPRTRVFAAGDPIIFRPILFILVGLEKYLFGYKFIYWQAIGIILHLVVVWSLLKLLMAIRRSIFAVLLTGLFSVLCVNTEMVTWNNINGGMVLVLAVLLIIRRIYLYPEVVPSRRRSMMIMTVLLTVACFTYEIGILFAVLIFLYLWWTYPRAPERLSFFWLLAPIFLYIAASFGNLFYLHINLAKDEVGFFKAGPLTTLWHSFQALYWWFLAGFFPTQYHFAAPIDRMMILKADPLFPPLDLGNGYVILCLTAFILYGIFAVRGMTLNFIRQRGKFLVLLCGMLFAWAFLIAVYRIDVRGLRFALGETLYYHYIFLAFFVVLLYTLVNFRQTQIGRGTKAAAAVLAILLVVLIAANGFMVRRLTSKMAEDYKPRRLLVNILESLIASKGREPGFSFYVDSNFPGNFVINSPSLTGKESIYKRYSFIELIYLQYFDAKNPRYVFAVTKDGPRVLLRPQPPAVMGP